MCLEARLLHWLYFPGSLSDSSRVLNRSTQLMWALTEGVWNNMVDSMSLLGFNTTSSLLLFKGRKCLVFLFSWYTFCLIAFSTMEDLDVLYSFMFESIFAYWHSLHNLCIWMNSLAGQSSADSWHLECHIPKQCFWFFLELLALPCLMLISFLVKKCFQLFSLFHFACGTSWCKHLKPQILGNVTFSSNLDFFSSSSDTKVTSKVSHGSYSRVSWWVTVNLCLCWNKCLTISTLHSVELLCLELYHALCNAKYIFGGFKRS